MMHFNDVCPSGSLNIELFTAFAIWYRFDDKQANSFLRLHRDDSGITVIITVNLCLLADSEQDAVGARQGNMQLTQVQCK
jgi:hypothetical protein